ncbi:ABC transporter substrate-binding protein [Sediminibacterium salmoneum]|uniref:ABC transporter substrate-binding protein n=1 Tax=Sediminibacterium salmoneum TaxID=426421 RepID=UPI0004AC672E|nr:helical backbone metal receptor [Sediminibacterium salmoneum]
MSTTSALRIVSLVPSITELLYDLGLEEQVVGITKFCVHPSAWFQSKIRIGGTKQIHIETIRSLKPTLIIASKEENIKEQVESLADFTEILLTDVVDYASALEMIEAVGKATETLNKAIKIRSRIEDEFRQLDTFLQQQQYPSLPCAYLIWKDPYMVAGGDTFIHSMLQKMNCVNTYGNQLRYPGIHFQDPEWLAAKIVFLSSEPYPFKEKHIGELRAQFPDKTFLLVDGEMFSWYGSRMLQAPAYFSSLSRLLNQTG